MAGVGWRGPGLAFGGARDFKHVTSFLHPVSLLPVLLHSGQTCWQGSARPTSVNPGVCRCLFNRNNHTFGSFFKPFAAFHLLKELKEEKT